MLSNLLFTSIAISLALQGPAPLVCPPKTVACANDTCSPIGVPCPSANEIAAASGEPLAPAAIPASILEPQWEIPPTAPDKMRAREWRSRRNDYCLESIDSFERRKIIRRLSLILPGAAALSASIGFAYSARMLRLEVDAINRASAAVASEYGVYPEVLDYGFRNVIIAGSVVFGLVGAGLVIGGLVSSNNMERAGGSCSAKGCTLTLRF